MNNAEYEDDWEIKKNNVPNKEILPINDNKMSNDSSYEKDWGLSNNPKNNKGPSFVDMMKDIMTGNVLDPEHKAQRGLFQTALKGSTFIPQDIGNSILGMGKDVSEGIPSLISQLISNPTQVTKNLGAGVAGIPVNIANTVLNLPAYLARLESDKLAGKVKNYTPQIQKEKMQNFIAGEPNQEDIDIRKLAELIPIGMPLAKVVGKAVINGTVPALKAAAAVSNKLSFGLLPGKTNPLLAKNKLQFELEKKQKVNELEKAKENYQQSKSAHDEAIAQSKREIGKSDIDLMEHNISNRKNIVQNLNNKISNLQQQLLETKPEKSALNQTKNILDELQESHEKAQQEVLAKEAAHQEVAEQSKQQTRKSNPDLMKYDLEKRQQDIQNQAQEAANLQQQLNNTKPEENSLPNAESNLNIANQSHENAKNTVQSINKNISQYLNSGSTHDVRVARIIKPKLEQIKENGNKLYDEVEDRVENKGISLSNTFDAKKISNDLMNLIKEGKSETPEALELYDKLTSIENKKIVSAKDYISALRSVKGYMRAAYKKAYEVGTDINEEKRNFFRKQGDEAKAKIEEMNNVLKNGIGEEDYNLLNDANSYWKNNVIPLYSEPLYWEILNKERLPAKDMITAFRGGKSGSGLEIIKNSIKNNPQAVRHMLGQRYDVNRKNIHNPNELTSEYLNQDLKLKSMLNEHQQAIKIAEQAKNNVELAENQHIEVQKKHKEATDLENRINYLHEKIENDKKEADNIKTHINQLRESINNKNISIKKKLSIEKEISALKIKHDELKKRHINAEKIESDIIDFTKRVNKHKEEIPKIEENISRLRKTLTNKNIDLKQKMIAQIELKLLNKKLKDTEIKLGASTTGLRKLYIISKTIYRTGKIFT